MHHFAFVRASLYGVDLREAFMRYLAWSETTTDLRYIQNRRDALLQNIIEAGRHLDATLANDAKITHLLDLLRSDAPVPSAVTLPTLEEWVVLEGMDPDAWSEAELIAEYKAAFGLDNADAIDAADGFKDPVAERVRALNHLATVLEVTPAAGDRLESWFARSTAKCLRNVGVLTLGDLVNFINLYGYRWHARVAGFGVQRASQVVAWLRMQYEYLNLLISDSVNEPKSCRALRQQLTSGKPLGPAGLGGLSLLASIPESALSQFGQGTRVQFGLQQMQSSDQLAGSSGAFRSHMANTLGADNDLQAVNAWLGRYQEKPATQRSYRKEVERFMLWCAQELKKPLSSVTAPDCQQYRAFLQAVPASWMQSMPVARTDVLWRAFRRQPSAASQKQALVILQTLFGGLVDAGYLVANPMRSLMKSFDLPPSKMDIRRSFTEAEWAHVLQCLDQVAVGPERLRLKCILELLVTSGIRLDDPGQGTLWPIAPRVAARFAPDLGSHGYGKAQQDARGAVESGRGASSGPARRRVLAGRQTLYGCRQSALDSNLAPLSAAVGQGARRSQWCASRCGGGNCNLQHPRQRLVSSRYLCGAQTLFCAGGQNRAGQRTRSRAIHESQHPLDAPHLCPASAGRWGADRGGQ
ncbi:MAG: hypothetical protein IPJ48_16970 [Propionivibrio sp.]|uniref:Core-binding (CB) domain-containing protein n=1 Tax=Candidatus Propionivibrio dominans TaxID=2954373 RepID=A0A9D7I8S3_9RHOO|nr:hypothetical protein [Candidatus Propionivibrio dominans]